MDSYRQAWVTRIFVGVDRRFELEWDIPFDDVKPCLRRLDALDALRATYEDVPMSGGLMQLIRPGAGDYHLAIQDAADEIKEVAEKIKTGREL